jgi:bacteriorhodopsin
MGFLMDFVILMKPHPHNIFKLFVLYLDILYVLWVELSKLLICQSAAVQTSVRNTRLLLLFSWGIYPIAYLLTMLARFDRSAIVDIHLGYTIIDVLGKPMFGLLVLAIALEKTKFDKDMGMPITTIHNSEFD